MNWKRRNLRLLVTILIVSKFFLIAANYQAGRNGAVVSASGIASRVGIEILKRGGNAVDAAIATGFALAVTYPAAGNLGGGGFALIALPDGRVTSIDFREKAPMQAFREMYLDSTGNVIENLSTYGALAAGIPGSVAGYYLMWQRYGSLPWKELLKPAIKLAKKGFPVSYQFHRSLQAYQESFSHFEESARIFYPGGKPPEINTWLKQKDLASTLSRIARKGPRDFYEGKTARLLVQAVQKHGGIWTLEDLKKYQAVEREPLQFNYRGYTIYSMGPPSSGGICLAMILKILEHFPLDSLGFHSAASIHYIVEAERFAYANRAYFLGDPDFVHIPVDYLLSQNVIDSLAALIPENLALKSDSISHLPPEESEETTHFSVIDKNGMAVSLTTTLNSSFGSKLVAAGTGVLLNNEMDDFSIKPGYPNLYGLVGAEANAIQPEKRMLSSMTPTIVFKNDTLLYLLGTPGGSTIITSVAQLIINLLDYKMSLWQAVDVPRFHHQWLPDVIFFEPFGLSPDTITKLKEMGYNPQRRSYIGDTNVIAVDYHRGVYIAVPDKRRNSRGSCY